MARSLPPYFQALAAYLGNKRQLAQLYFALLAEVLPRERWPQLRLLDPFCGSGAVALHAKALGFDVIAGDIALRSVIPARALVANSSVLLGEHDVLDLFTPDPDAGMIARSYSPRLFSGEQAALLDNALARARRRSEPVRSLLLQLLIKLALRSQPNSMLRAVDARAAATGDYDAIGPRRLGHYLKAAQLFSLAGLLGLAQDVNHGVFGGRGEARHGDARELLRTVTADIAYLDPPYPGTTSYAGAYRPLDALLGDTVPTGPRLELTELLDAAAAHPFVMLTYGGPWVTLEHLTATLTRFRPVLRALAIPYRHLGPIASEERNATNREFFVVAGR
jgi:adenine-specific DNA-methyltransferase